MEANLDRMWMHLVADVVDDSNLTIKVLINDPSSCSPNLFEMIQLLFKNAFHSISSTHMQLTSLLSGDITKEVTQRKFWASPEVTACSIIEIHVQASL